MSDSLTTTLKIIDESSKVLKGIETASKGVSLELDKLVSFDTSELTSGLRNVAAPLKDIGNDAVETQEKVGGAFSGMVADIAHVFTAIQGVIAAFQKLGSMAVSAISTGDEIAKTSRALHINAQAYQELSYAAQRGGASQSEFVHSLKTLDRQLAQLNSGSAEVEQAFRSIGISRKDLAGKDLEGSLYAISDALNEMEDSGNAAKVAQTLLGTQGYKTAAAFSVGADELDRLREEARQTGIIMDDMTLDLAEYGADELLNVQLQIQSIWQKIGVAIMPQVVKVLEKIDSLFKENADTINQIAGFAGQLADNVLPVVMQLITIIMRCVNDVFSYIMPYVPAIMDFIGTVIDGVRVMIEEFGDSIVVIGGVIAALMGVKTVLLAIAANPIMAIITGAIAIISFIEGMRKKSEEFFEVTQKIGIHLAMFVDTFISGLIAGFQKIGNAIGRVWTFVTGFVQEAFGKALGKLAGLWNDFVDFIGLDSLKVDTGFWDDVEKAGNERRNDATDLSKDFYFDATGTLDGLSARLETGFEDLAKTGRELGWKEPTRDILDRMDASMKQSAGGTNAILGTLNSGVRIDKDSILFMKEMATAEIINRYNDFSPTITQSFNSNQPFEAGQIETLSGSAIDGAMSSMRAAI